MGCFFSCFRIKDSSSNSENSRFVEILVNRKESPLSLPFFSEGNASTPTKEKGVEELELNFDELKDEAKFLKACGTIPEIPTEIQTVVRVQNELSSPNAAVGSPKFKSWLTGTSVEELDLETPPDYSRRLVTHFEEWKEDLSSLPWTSCRQLSERFSPNSSQGNDFPNAICSKLWSSPDNGPTDSSVSPGLTAPSISTVHFNCEPKMPSVSSQSPSEAFSNCSSESGSCCKSSYWNPSPYPTPLKLADQMQTPGTIFPAYMDEIALAKHPWIRSRYVHSAIQQPAGSLLKWKMLDDENLCSDQLNNDTREPLLKTDDCRNTSTCDNSGVEELNLEASLSPWLKGHPSNEDPLILGGQATAHNLLSS